MGLTLKAAQDGVQGSYSLGNSRHGVENRLTIALFQAHHSQTVAFGVSWIHRFRCRVISLATLTLEFVHCSGA